MRVDRLTLAAAIPVALAILLWLLSLAGTNPLPEDAYRVQAVVPTSDSLSPPAEVRIDGVRVGTVADIAEHGPRGRASLLLLDLDTEHAPVFRDATARVRLRTLVGENYVELDPGRPSSGALPDGGTLGIAQAQEYVASDDVFSAFEGRSRGHFRGQLRELGTALGDRGGDLNRTLAATAALTDASSPVAATLSAHRAEVSALVDDLGVVMSTLGERSSDIRLFARRSDSALSALDRRDEHLERSLRQLPGTLRQARATSAGLAALSGSATPVLRNLRVSAEELPPLMRDLGPAAAAARRTMASLDTFSRRGTPALESLKAFAASGAEAAPALGGLLRHYNPFARYIARYAQELGAFAANMRSLSNAVDATGKLARINGVVTPSTVAAFTPEMKQIYGRLRELGALEESLGPHHLNPYPAPGKIADPGPFEGPYPRVQAEAPYR